MTCKQRRINNTDDPAHDISEPGIMTTGKQLLVFGSMSATEQAYYEDKMTYRKVSKLDLSVSYRVAERKRKILETFF